MSYEDKSRAQRPAEADPEPFDTAAHGAPDPSWPPEDQLRWYSRYSHILLLNSSEGVRRRAAAQADQEVARAMTARIGASVSDRLGETWLSQFRSEVDAGQPTTLS